MLARTFKTAEELELSDKEYNALLQLLEKAENGELHHIDDDRSSMPYKGEGLGFNMENWSQKCGTVKCLGGWCDTLFGTAFACDVKPTGLRHLFFATNTELPMDSITAEQATHALRTYLETGTPDWNDGGE